MSDEKRYLPASGMPTVSAEHKQKLNRAIGTAQSLIDAGIVRGEYTNAQITGISFDENEGFSIDVTAQGSYDLESMQFELKAITFDGVGRDDA